MVVCAIGGEPYGQPRVARRELMSLAQVCARRKELVSVPMMLPPKASQSTMAAHNRGSSKRLAQHGNKASHRPPMM